MRLLIAIALKHLLARKRQSIVSLLGIILGVGFFLAISSLMQGSEKDFLKRLVDNSPHITIDDEYRAPREQPVHRLFKGGAVQLHNVQPQTETRGIRNYERVLTMLRGMDIIASPVLAGQGVMTFAGQDRAVTLNGMVPSEIGAVSSIDDNMVEGTIDDLAANPDGVIIGAELVRRLSLSLDRNVTITSPGGQVKVFKVVGIFRTGRSGYDNSQAFLTLKRAQALLNRPNRVNSIIMKVPDPYQARAIASEVESRIGYKSMSWQESSEDLMNTLAIRNAIMYTVVSAVLVVAGFGIYNVISTVVIEKQRDIAILKSMGFYAKDVKRIFVLQGIVLGIVGCATGIPLGCAIMLGLMQIKMKPPGSSAPIQMPIDWSWPQFAIAAAFAICAAVLAALLPARKAAHVQPVDILRGGAA